MTQTLSDLTKSLLQAAKRAGAEAADALATESRSVSIEVRDGALEQAERSDAVEVGLRVLIGKRQACVAASDISADSLTALAERAVDMARIAPEDPYIGLAEADQLAQGWDVDALDLIETAEPPLPADLQAAATAVEAVALGVDGISKVDTAAAFHGQTEIFLAASNGFSGGYKQGAHGLSCVAITGSGTGMERDYAGETRVYHSDLSSPEEIGLLAAERTLARAGAVRPPTGHYPVLYDERVAAGLIGHLVEAANGANVARGSSWLLERLGEQVLPAGLDIVTDPHRPRVPGSKPFDAEGLPTQKRHIVENGRLMGWTTDLATARKLDVPNTANAGRGLSAPPRPGLGGFALSESADSREALIRDMGEGLLVTSLIGATINPNTGDYSRGASGFWVKGGEICHAVNECTIAGNLHEMLAGLRPANDARGYLSRVVPSLLVEGLTIAGE